MTDTKIIAVVGGTGAQGGGLVRAILADRSGGFAARVLTRQPDGPKARALAAQGAEVVEADLDQPAQLARAFDGAHAAFCVTNFWEHFSPEREKQQARHMAEAAAAAGVRHAVWSTFEDTRERVPLSDDRMPTLMERYKVAHFDAKAEANAFFTEAGVPTTFLYTSYYWDNMIHFGTGPTRGADGTLALTLPMGEKKLPGIAAEDIGPCVYGIFQAGDAHVGRSIGIAGEHLTGHQMAQGLADALGEPVAYNAVTPDAYRAFGFPGAMDMGNMFQYKADFESEYCGMRDVTRTRDLHPGLMTYRDWLARYQDQIPLG